MLNSVRNRKDSQTTWSFFHRHVPPLLMNDCLVVYIERDVTCSIDNKTIMQRFQNMKTHRKQ